MLQLAAARDGQHSHGAVHGSPTEAVRAADDLRQWLSLTVEEVARLTGVSRSAILYWKRKNAQPRPSAARNLFRIHALVRALRVSVGPDHPLSVMRRGGDGASAYDLLMEGRYDDAEQLLRPLIFPPERKPVQQRQLVRWADEDPPAAAVLGGGLALKPR